MKTISLLSIISRLFLGSALGAEDKRPTAQIIFHVVTDEGKIVSNAEVWAATFHHWEPGDSFGKDIPEEKHGITDGAGDVTITLQSLRGDVIYAVTGGDAYYRTSGLKYQFKENKDGRWMPWSPTIEVVLKPIVKPIPMYARQVGGPISLLVIPEFGKPVGFDLMVSDWTAPYGKGNSSDVIFTMERNFTGREEPFKAKLTVAFSNEGDGIQSVFAAPLTGSALKLPRRAPEEGYASELIKQKVRPGAHKAINETKREDQNYFFRVRSTLDEKKRVKSAVYGKIDGDIEFWPDGNLRFTYYLNPEPNDRNMEFDMKRNLFPNLPSLQSPRRP